MPSTYAHRRFGRDVLERLPEEQRERIFPYIDLYRIGLHGPDILFYYHPLRVNGISAIGYDQHTWTGEAYFRFAGGAAAKSADPEAARAYVMGFVCHFALDSFCHPYIEEKIEADGVRHTEIESEFDRMLLEKDGFAPLAQDLTSHIRPRDEYARIIAPFFPPAAEAQIREALESMIRYNRMLRDHRLFVRLSLLLTGNYPEMHGMMLPRRRDARLADSDRTLAELYGKAADAAPGMMAEVDGLLRGRPLTDARFRHTFGAA